MSKHLTTQQISYFNKYKINVGGIYMFPRWGFNFYWTPNKNAAIRIDNNPLTKSIDHEYFLVKEKVGDFYRGNFYRNPYKTTFILKSRI